MKIANSLKSLKKHDKNCRIVRRKGRVYVINKSNPRFKARQGCASPSHRLPTTPRPSGRGFLLVPAGSGST